MLSSLWLFRSSGCALSVGGSAGDEQAMSALMMNTNVALKRRYINHWGWEVRSVLGLESLVLCAMYRPNIYSGASFGGAICVAVGTRLITVSVL